MTVNMHSQVIHNCLQPAQVDIACRVMLLDNGNGDGMPHHDDISTPLRPMLDAA
jgi:hypothetical protein